MPRLKLLKTNFTAGEVNERLLGRGDLTAYTNGARRLRNVQVFPTGGLSRRPGLRFVAAALGRGRLVAFEFNTEQTYLLVFTDQKVSVLEDDAVIATIDAPWAENQIGSITWTQSADTLLICHPEVPPKKILRKDATIFEIEDWSFFEKDGRIYQPTHKFSKDAITLKASATSGTVTLTASGNLFVAAHVGTRFRIIDKEVEITAVATATSATAKVKQTLDNTDATKDWEEQAFSAVRGWPVAVCFHQDRMVVGGSRDLPNRIWLSKSSDLFNFDLGTGEDDEAIEFAILSDQVNAIRAVFSGRHLQVFTSGAEWMVTGDPLTPTNLQLKRQTRVGSPVGRSVPPRDVDGATLYVSRTGTELREFLFTDVEQAYQSNDLAILARHVLKNPLDQDFQKSSRLMYLVMEDGTIATVTVYRQEQVTAWTVYETDGDFLSVCAVGDDVYALVDRESGIYVERFDASLNTDSAVTAESGTARTVWGGLDHLDGDAVQVVADGIYQGVLTVSSGEIGLSNPASKVEIGLAYAHEIVPLPVFHPGGFGAGQGSPVRLVRGTFRLLDTRALTIDTGKGLTVVPFRRFNTSEVLDTPTPPFTGDKTIRALGWTRGDTTPLWRIEQDVPLPCTILSVLTEISALGQ